MDVETLVDELNEKMAQDGTVDRIALIEGIEVIGTILSKIIGILAAVIIVAVPIIVAVELMYINFPILQSPLDSLMRDGRPAISKLTQFTLGDAIKALDRSRTTDYEKNPNLIYLGIKIKSVYIIFFIIALVLGGSNMVVGLVGKLLEGIIDLIVSAVN